jgi:hypothetical protein
VLTLIVCALLAIAAAWVYVMVAILGFGLIWAVAPALALVVIGERRARLWDERRRSARLPVGSEPETAGPIRRTGNRVAAGLGGRRLLPLTAVAVVTLPAVVGAFVDSGYWNAVLVITIAIAVLVQSRGCSAGGRASSQRRPVCGSDLPFASPPPPRSAEGGRGTNFGTSWRSAA